MVALLQLRNALLEVNNLARTSNYAITIMSGLVNGIGSAFSAAFGIASGAVTTAFDTMSDLYDTLIKPIVDRLTNLSIPTFNLVNPFTILRNELEEIKVLIDNIKDFSLTDVVTNLAPDSIASPVRAITAAGAAYQTASNNPNFTFHMTQNLSGITDKLDKKNLAKQIANEMSREFKSRLGVLPGGGGLF
tara:strand:- start:15415 stop:15984 length:570 start_codon:yes stop_codon:yes gene_type:complete